MEKPRKRIVSDDRTVTQDDSARAYNKGIEDMSTWIEGEIPTAKEIKNLAHEYIYNDPLGWNWDELCLQINALLTRKLTGKV
jgi:hypothetical protein